MCCNKIKCCYWDCLTLMEPISPRVHFRVFKTDDSKLCAFFMLVYQSCRMQFIDLIRIVGWNVVLSFNHRSIICKSNYFTAGNLTNLLAFGINSIGPLYYHNGAISHFWVFAVWSNLCRVNLVPLLQQQCQGQALFIRNGTETNK